MMNGMIKRSLTKKLEYLSKKYPVVSVVGPRQSGKTTLIKNVFKNKPYVSLETPEMLAYAENDPRGFLSEYPKGAILDEVQRSPHLFSYIQGIVDDINKPGMFILSGSQHFLLLEKITQSLAGRVALLNLLPLSIDELFSSGEKVNSLEEIMFKGMYPRLYNSKINPLDFYPSYIQTYLERDVRSIKNVTSLNSFQKFIKMCAGRSGQLLNLSSLSIDCGVTHNTIKSWISILEASFIVHLLYPHYKNFNKRLVKMPKLYFLDAGLMCSLLEIKNKNQIQSYPLRGNIFETFIVSELLKYRFNKGLRANLYFWRDKVGHEIDCILDKGLNLTPIEIKSGKTITSDMFKHIEYWKKVSGKTKNDSYLIYGGSNNQKRNGVDVLSWKDCNIL